MCKVVVFGHTFKSAEHAFQWKKCMDCLRDDLADRILRAPSPARAKQIAMEVDGNALKKWHDVKGHIMVMSDVLMAKSDSNIDFRNTLLNTDDRILAEATACTKWGCGLSPELAVTAKQFPGMNMCGQLLMELRSNLRPSTGTKVTDGSFISLRPATSPMSCAKTPLINPKSTTSVTPETTRSDTLSTEQSSKSSLVPNHDVIIHVTSPSPQKTSTESEPTRTETADSSILPDPPMTPPSRGRTISLRSNAARAQSPLAGKLVLRKHLKAIPLLKPELPDESGNESYPELDIEWPNWDRDSIASEITRFEDCDILH